DACNSKQQRLIDFIYETGCRIGDYITLDYSDIKDHIVIILEDIVDSGFTLDHIMKQLSGYEPDEIKIACMFFKPKAYQMNFPVDYVGMEIPNDFIIGYGLDYNGFGRNLSSLYKLDGNK
ncbi:MAG: hypothetical protein DRI73_03615, partial [Bacteroidetes bacterium]